MHRVPLSEAHEADEGAPLPTSCSSRLVGDKGVRKGWHPLIELYVGFADNSYVHKRR